MKDKDLETKMMRTLLKLERQNDAVGDTPKRHEISRLLCDIRKLVQAPPNPGYE